MSGNSLLFLAVIFAFFTLSLFVISRPKPAPRSEAEIPRTPAGQPSAPAVFAPQENSGGEVDVKVTPLVLKAGEKPQFEIEFNTHSVELDFDISQIASLTDEDGNSDTSSTWEGSPPGGHHREGTLTFPTPLIQTKSVNLTIRDISGVSKREFTWQL